RLLRSSRDAGIVGGNRDRDALRDRLRVHGLDRCVPRALGAFTSAERNIEDSAEVLVDRVLRGKPGVLVPHEDQLRPRRESAENLTIEISFVLVPILGLTR